MIVFNIQKLWHWHNLPATVITVTAVDIFVIAVNIYAVGNHNPMNFYRRILSKLDAEPILLSHHPMCGRFGDHMFNIKGRAVCIGCVTVYPSALISLAFLLAAGINSFGTLLYIAVAPFLLNLFRLVLKKRRVFSVFFNILLGVSLASSVLCIICAPDSIRIFVFLFVLAAASVFVFLKGMRVFMTCRRCLDYPNFPACRMLNHR